MLTRPQQILLKRAQQQAGVADEEYRDTLERFCGVRSSTDPRMGDEHLDIVLSYLEAIYWRGHDAGHLPAPCKANAPFLQRGYWASKNPKHNTSRDRYNADELNVEIAALEGQLGREFGCGPGYFSAIKDKVIPEARRHMVWPAGLVKYKAALERTLEAKRRKHAQPF
jgi:hypothetical protein